MADETAAVGDDFDDEPQEPATNTPATGNDLGDGGKKALSEERKARRTAEKERAELATRLKQFEDRDKTEAQKLEERATAAEARAQENETALLRMRVAVTKGLSADLVDRLRGSTEQELSADADALLALVAPDRRTDVDQGVRGNPAPAGMNDLIRRGARR